MRNYVPNCYMFFCKETFFRFFPSFPGNSDGKMQFSITEKMPQLDFQEFSKKYWVKSLRICYDMRKAILTSMSVILLRRALRFVWKMGTIIWFSFSYLFWISLTGKVVKLHARVKLNLFSRPWLIETHFI